MKRYLELTSDIEIVNYDSNSWSINFNILPEDLFEFFIEIQLILNYSLALTIKSLKKRTILNFTLDKTINISKLELTSDRYKIIFSQNDMDTIVSYILKYYLDKSVFLGHLDIQLLNVYHSENNPTFIFNIDKDSKKA